MYGRDRARGNPVPVNPVSRAIHVPDTLQRLPACRRLQELETTFQSMDEGGEWIWVFKGGKSDNRLQTAI